MSCLIWMLRIRLIRNLRNLSHPISRKLCLIFPALHAQHSSLFYFAVFTQNSMSLGKLLKAVIPQSGQSSVSLGQPTDGTLYYHQTKPTTQAIADSIIRGQILIHVNAVI